MNHSARHEGFTPMCLSVPGRAILLAGLLTYAPTRDVGQGFRRLIWNFIQVVLSVQCRC